MNHLHKNFLVALAGQPNVGKSTIFNMLTGARQHIANFPGVTVEKKWGHYHSGEHKIELVDLPGTYSLSSYTDEERIARNFILLERPELVLVVVDASNLERNLPLVFQIREMRVPIVVALNMMDVAERRGIVIDVERLSAELGMPVIPTVGNVGRGKAELAETVHSVIEAADHKTVPLRVDYGPDLEAALGELERELTKREHLMEDFSARWLALRIMENDREVQRMILHHTHDGREHDVFSLIEKRIAAFDSAHTVPAAMQVARGRYRAAHGICAKCVRLPLEISATLSDRIDRCVLHPVVGYVILGLVLYGFYELTMNFGIRVADYWFEYLQKIRHPVEALFPSTDIVREGLLKSLLTDGLIEGIVSIVYYAPVFFILYVLIAALEDSGYMARIAFLMDSFLDRFGLNGQTTLPLLLGGAVVGGCAVPGVLATRTIRDPKTRLITILVIPLMNCIGKIPVFVLVIDLFFAERQGAILFAASIFSLLTALLLAKIFSRHLIRNDAEPFIMELPAYHVPTLRGVFGRAFFRLRSFLAKVVTVVACVQVVFWFFLTFPGPALERELEFDRVLQDCHKTLLAETEGADEAYRSAVEHPTVYRLALFCAKYRADLAAADAGDEAAVMHTYEERNRRFFVLSNDGLTAGGDTVAAALPTARAFTAFMDDVEEIKTTRRREILQRSLAGRVGRFFEPATMFAGFNWRINIGMLSSFAARENLVGTLGTIYSVSDARAGGEALSATIRNNEPTWTGRNAWALLVFIALMPPCLPTVIAIKTETASVLWTLFAMVYPVAVGFLAAVTVFQLGRFFG